MKRYRKILTQLGVRVLLAAPPFAVGWHMIALAQGNRGGIPLLLLTMGCFVGCAVIVAPPIARLIAEPAGALYYPEKPCAEPPPDYDVPKSLKESGLYEDALKEYEKIAAEYPEEVKPYIEMIDIVAVNLKDDKRAEAVFRKGLSMLPDSEDREVLKAMFAALTFERRGLPGGF